MILESEERCRVLDPPETAEAAHCPAGPCVRTRGRVGLDHAAAVRSTWLGSDQGGILSGRTGMNVKLYWLLHNTLQAFTILSMSIGSCPALSMLRPERPRPLSPIRHSLVASHMELIYICAIPSMCEWWIHFNEDI